MTSDIKDYLKENPHLKTVYVNEKNEYLFFKRDGFDKEYSRDEVLEMELPEKPVQLEDIEKVMADLIKVEAERDELKAEIAKLKSAKKAKKESTDIKNAE